jgi:XapX domain-containing protein
MVKALLGLVLGLLIGAACRFFDIPVPSPPKLVGAMLVVSMTLGYVVTDRYMTAKSKPAATTSAMCGGPTGATAERQGGGGNDSNASPD